MMHDNNSSSPRNIPAVAMVLSDMDGSVSGNICHHSNPPFGTKEAAQNYLSSISPPRDLVCPITQEIYNTPVVASDGNTYEKHAIKTWFDAQRNSTGSIRSPVTNAYMDLDAAGTMLVENKAVASMGRSHKEKLGEELCLRCQAIFDNAPDALGDEGFRIKGLVEAGADLTLKGCEGGNTAFMCLLLSRFAQDNEQIRYDLLNYFMVHSVQVSLVNDDGQSCLDLAKELLSANDKVSNTNTNLTIPYQQLLQQISQKSKIEMQRKKVQSEKRDEYNNEQRERQRVLADNARNREPGDNDVVNADGLGRMESGWGYFPCLPALLFQGNVPAPPASFADEETKEKKRLQVILRFTTIAVTLFWLLC